MKLFSLLLVFCSILSVTAQAQCLSHRQIMNEIRTFSASNGGDANSITEHTPIQLISTNLVAAWEDLDNIAKFRACGMNLGPNDLRFVTTAGELAGVIMWNLNLKK